MNIKRFSLILLILIAISLTAVSAADNVTEVVHEDAQSDEVLSVDVAGNTAADVQNAITNAKDGDTINLGTNKAYNFGSDSVNVDKKITITGNNVSITGNSSNGIVSIRNTENVTVKGINFINPNDVPGYGGRIYGTAIYTNAVTNLLVDNCKFYNYEYEINMYGTTQSTVKNSWFTGVTTTVSGTAGTGTKGIQLMSSSKYISIINNTFTGKIYDGLSIASSSTDVYIENNTFINTTFPIFYGGSSTKGNVIKYNKFITCGMINTTYTGPLGTETVYIDNLPWIALKKASNDIQIIGNEFTVKDNNLLIYSEKGNDEHGFPSPIGGIVITDNIVKKADSTVKDDTVIFYYLNVVDNLEIDPASEIVIKNNNFTDIPNINNFKLEFKNIEINGTDVTIPKAKTTTYFTVVSAMLGKVVIGLCDASGNKLPNLRVEYYINGASKKVVNTDEYGHVYIEGLTDTVKIRTLFTGNDLYYTTDFTTEIQANPSQANSQITAGTLSVSTASAANTNYQIILKDASGTVLADKQVNFAFNGKIYTSKTDTKGVASLKIPTSAAGKYGVTVSFDGDSNYKGSTVVSTINIVKQATKLTVAKKTFKKSAAKKVTATLKAGSKALKGKKLTLNVNGKTYKATTNAKGVATFKIKLTKKGTFKATTKFAGDSQYNAKTTKSKIIVK